MEVSVDISSTGIRDGDEVVQLYVRDLMSSVAQPVRRLVAFDRRHVGAGQTSHDRVFGICVAVDDIPRPGADGKTVTAGGHRSAALVPWQVTFARPSTGDCCGRFPPLTTP